MWFLFRDNAKSGTDFFHIDYIYYMVEANPDCDADDLYESAKCNAIITMSDYFDCDSILFSYMDLAAYSGDLSDEDMIEFYMCNGYTDDMLDSIGSGFFIASDVSIKIPMTTQQFLKLPFICNFGSDTKPTNKTLVSSSREAGGMKCAGPCGNFSPFSEPNQANGTFICYSCRI